MGFSQQIDISGNVKDEKKEAMPFVNIIVKSTNESTTSDFEGNYNIKAKANDTLIFSFVGYTRIEEPINNRSQINIQFLAEFNQLKEVVVTALGIEKDEKALGYDIDQVDNSEVTEAKQVNFANSLIKLCSLKTRNGFF